MYSFQYLVGNALNPTSSIHLLHFVLFFLSIITNFIKIVLLSCSSHKMELNLTIFSSVTFMYEAPQQRHEVYNVCINQPMKVVSDGIWTQHSGAGPSQSAFTLLEMQIVIIFAVTQGFHFIFKRYSIPFFVSQTMVRT